MFEAIPRNGFFSLFNCPDVFSELFLVSDALSSESWLVFYKFYNINKQCKGAIEKILCQQATSNKLILLEEKFPE